MHKMYNISYTLFNLYMRYYPMSDIVASNPTRKQGGQFGNLLFNPSQMRNIIALLGILRKTVIPHPAYNPLIPFEAYIALKV